MIVVDCLVQYARTEATVTEIKADNTTSRTGKCIKLALRVVILAGSIRAIF